MIRIASAVLCAAFLFVYSPAAFANSLDDAEAARRALNDGKAGEALALAERALKDNRFAKISAR